MDKQQQQAILARDMIDMIRTYSDNADVLEYLEGFSFSLARIFEDKQVVSWDDVASICDQRYYSLKQDAPVPLNGALLDKCEQQIRPHLPR